MGAWASHVDQLLRRCAAVVPKNDSQINLPGKFTADPTVAIQTDILVPARVDDTNLVPDCLI